MRIAAALSILVFAAILGGCGGSYGDDSSSGAGPERAGTSTAPAGASAQACPLDVDGVEGLRVTGVPCREGQQVALGWRRAKECAKFGSRSGCSLRSYRCVASATDRGWSVSCAKAGSSIAFTVRRG
jgi:hypothetical protein